jgi:hypothetical protein
MNFGELRTFHRLVRLQIFVLGEYFTLESPKTHRRARKETYKSLKDWGPVVTPGNLDNILLDLAWESIEILITSFQLRLYLFVSGKPLPRAFRKRLVFIRFRLNQIKSNQTQPNPYHFRYSDHTYSIH